MPLKYRTTGVTRLPEATSPLDVDQDFPTSIGSRGKGNLAAICPIPWYHQHNCALSLGTLSYGHIISTHHLDVRMAADRKFWRYCKISVLFIFSFSAFYFYITRRDDVHISYPSPNSPNPSELKSQTLSSSRHPLTPPYPYPYKESHDAIPRLTIRETWGNESNYRDVAVVTVVLIGVPLFNVESNQKLLAEEMKSYGDIVQQDFMDTYYNLTLKTLMGMEWISKYCPGASYVMKIDSDMFLNVDYLVHHLLQPGLPVRQNYITGFIIADTGPIRDKEYKCYVPKEVYPNDTYPPYPAGPGYVFSADMAKKIYDVAQTIRVVPIEDAFVGICLYELKIPLTDPPPNIFNGDRIDYDLCQFNKLITVHHYAGDELRRVWTDFWTQRSGCKSLFMWIHPKAVSLTSLKGPVILYCYNYFAYLEIVTKVSYLLLWLFWVLCQTSIKLETLFLFLAVQCREKWDFPVQTRDCGLSCQKRDRPSKTGQLG
ncbi:hypothetical protein XELAEV_18019033mg, partial [Xenopus laevis]